MIVLNSTTFKLDIERIGHILDMDEFKIHEAKEHGKSTLISTKFFNKGVYRVRNANNGRLENIAVNIDKIAAVTYEGLVKELGEDCVDKNLWKDVPEGEAIFFYSLTLENDFIK
ncbi:MAG: hypothetical protein KKD69_05395 [Euryarchaeota archaeon]|nr:hypothetical protein [Euryarchaeota archaeon]MBU4491879.1 hypothetical protein [Euryarchaeota archaeon]MCG2727132.1 hypothetical protein [Candidatus Methanoperedenaceae archaeon]